MKVYLIWIMFVFAMGICEGGDLLYPLGGKTPRQVLAKAESFGFGVAEGMLPDDRATDVAFRRVISAIDARKQFADLFAEDNAVAKLYALYALYHLDRKLYAKLKVKAKPDMVVETQDGCVIGRSTTGKLLKALEKGAYAHLIKDLMAKKAKQ